MGFTALVPPNKALINKWAPCFPQTTVAGLSKGLQFGGKVAMATAFQSLDRGVGSLLSLNQEVPKLTHHRWSMYFGQI